MDSDKSVESITISDLVMLRNLVHIASKRGAFSAEEFSEIGTVYSRVDTFLKKNIKQDESESKNVSESNPVETSDSTAENVD